MRRLGITTTADRGRDLAPTALLNDLEPVILPCIEVTPESGQVLAEARSLAARSDWLLLTSPRVVSVLWPDGQMPVTSVAAVGSATAEAVAAAGGTVAIEGDGGLGALIPELTRRSEGAFVFYPHADGADMTSLYPLDAKDTNVSSLAVYRTRPSAPGLDPVDAVLFGSPSAVEGWSMSRSFEEVVIGVIGQTTEAALRVQGRTPDVVAIRPGFESLVALIADHMSERSPI